MSADDLEIQASAWLAREDRGLTPEEGQAQAAWLAQSSLHKVAYLRLKASWRRADRLAALKGAVLRDRSGRGRAFRLRISSIAAAMLLLGGAAYLGLHLQTGQAYATAIGQMQTVRLADGTQMELNTNTRIHADVTAAYRMVTLDSGEAYFDVVHDAKHPFVVTAGNRRITDIGTKFSVFRNGDDVRVIVMEGSVRVEDLARPAITRPVIAEAGRVVIARGDETLVAAKSDRDIVNDLSWRSGMLVFDQKTLAEAATQFNRYNNRQILVEGSARKIRIGGRFKADNVDVFVQLLHQGFGLSINNEGGRIVVSR